MKMKKFPENAVYSKRAPNTISLLGFVCYSKIIQAEIGI